MGVTLTPDSSSSSSRPKTLIVDIPTTDVATPSMPNTGFANGSPFINIGGVYPPCPGDPYNASFPPTPICPDPITGAYPSSFPSNLKPSGYYKNNSAYATQAGVASNFKNADAYCPDICITTRQSVPTTPPSVVDTSVIVTSFQNENCPMGYVQKAEFNPQPAIVLLSDNKWHFVPKYEPTSLICARVIPTWTPAN